MLLSKSRLFAVGLLMAGLGAAVVLGTALPQWRSALAAGATAPADKAPSDAAGKHDETGPREGGMRVEAPHAKVDVDKERGKVSVSAPHTEVSVDPDEGRVRVRAPCVDLDIRW